MVMWCSSHGTVTERTAELKGRVRDPHLSQAELMKVLPASVPVRLEGETDQLAEEQDRFAQRGQVEGRVDDRA